MGIVLRTLKWVLLLLLLLVAAVLGIPQLMAFMDKIGSDQRSQWLADHTVYQGPVNGSGVFSFPSNFYDNRLFLFGEIHGYAAPHDFDFALIKHLNEKAGVRYLVAELDPAQALAVNDYLATGDDKKVRRILDAWADVSAQWGNKQFLAKLNKLRALNQSLPSRSRIGFIGVDQPQNRPLFDEFVSQASSFDTGHPAQAINLELANVTGQRTEGASRYAHILANIEVLIASLSIQNEKLYGFWGFFHVLETTVNGDQKPLAMHLNEHPSFSGGVASLLSAYGQGSFSMMPGSMMPAPLQGPNGEAFVTIPGGMNNPYMYYLHGESDLRKAAGGAQVSVFSIDNDGSPYKTGNRLVKGFGLMTMMQQFNIDGSASDATDYIVYFENSPALTPWRGEAYDVSGQGQ